jgi:protein required for attachment to host cells
MSKFWVLVADESAARLFSSDKIRVELNEIEVLTNPEARIHERELGTERQGRGFESANPSRHAMEPSSSIREERARQFAREIVRKLEQGANQQAYERLILAAPPDFLGLLRQQLKSGLKERLAQSIDKNLLKETPKAILKHLNA